MSLKQVLGVGGFWRGVGVGGGLVFGLDLFGFFVSVWNSSVYHEIV